MSEDLVDLITETEGTKEKAPGHKVATEAPTPAPAVALPVTASPQDPGAAPQTGEPLRDQSARVELQLQRHNLLALRLRIGFQVLLILIGLFLVLGILVMVRDAFTSDLVVIEPFDAPPALAERGVSGKVVAAGLLDELAILQNATRADAAKRDLSNAWSKEIKLEVPNTGVSLGEISQLLTARFGNDVHIGGDLVLTEAGGLALSVRGDGIPPKVFNGSSDGLEKLVKDAAEYVYSKSEPVLWAYYLANRGRTAESAEFSRLTFAVADKADQPYLLNTWANALLVTQGTNPQSLSLYRASVKLKPDYWVAYSNIILLLAGAGDEEGAWRAGNELRKAAGGRPGRAPETYYQNWDPLVGNYGPMLEAVRADAEAYGGIGASGSVANGLMADVHVRLHDPEAAELMLQTAPADADDPIIGALTRFVRGRLAAEAGDLQRAADEMDAFNYLYANPAVWSNLPGYHCWAGAIADAAGRTEAADRLFASKAKFLDCYRFRADALDRRGDWAGAQRAYAEAVALAPNLPGGHLSWGEALARHGDLAGAERLISQAHQKGPTWADPLKSWGDLLARQKKWRAAQEKYNQALRFAPEWAALIQVREAMSAR